MMKILSNLEDATIVDHPTEYATAGDLINHFTEKKDKHDDIMDEFRQMQREKETTPQHQKPDNI